ncbi:HAD-IIB family hydrolase (plasmid) [Rhizobium sp. RCAM05350]|uniref:HAD-IIB family hydrolase n=1 Tax=Rhizobium sp. RCAM05350 TaxID=2895568 RepID=UPI0020768533|nr:HAD-IIB family hydrolase [Rhizobium sp. RCAM05350]URK89415.1 HAD-IIB family hydrolase [Rhizobium sp. RCAM05350]
MLTHGYDLPAKVVEALGRLRAGGVEIVLASARSPQALRPYAARLETLELAACFNGGWIGNLRTGATIASTTIGLTALWYGYDRVYASERNPLIEHEVAVTGESLDVVESWDQVAGEPGKIMCVRGNADDLSGFDAMTDAFGSRLSLIRSHWRLLEINPKGVSKRATIEQMSRHRSVSQENCAAAGDAENDVEMLRWAAVALTVDNAIGEIKSFTDFIGPTCDEGGMALAADWLGARLAGYRGENGGEENG